MIEDGDPFLEILRAMRREGWRQSDGLWLPPRAWKALLFEFVAVPSRESEGLDELERREARGITLAQAIRLRWIYRTLTREMD